MRFLKFVFVTILQISSPWILPMVFLNIKCRYNRRRKIWNIWVYFFIIKLRITWSLSLDDFSNAMMQSLVYLGLFSQQKWECKFASAGNQYSHSHSTAQQYRHSHPLSSPLLSHSRNISPTLSLSLSLSLRLFLDTTVQTFKTAPPSIIIVVNFINIFIVIESISLFKLMMFNSNWSEELI